MTELKGFKFMTILCLGFKKKKEIYDETKYSTFYLNSEKIINKSDIRDVLESIYNMIISNIQKSLGKWLGWIIDSVIDHDINI